MISQKYHIAVHLFRFPRKTSKNEKKFRIENIYVKNFFLIACYLQCTNVHLVRSRAVHIPLYKLHIHIYRNIRYSFWYHSLILSNCPHVCHPTNLNFRPLHLLLSFLPKPFFFHKIMRLLFSHRIWKEIWQFWTMLYQIDSKTRNKSSRN